MSGGEGPVEIAIARRDNLGIAVILALILRLRRARLVVQLSGVMQEMRERRDEMLLAG